jgi:hypothetical protein
LLLDIPRRVIQSSKFMFPSAQPIIQVCDLSQ